MYIYKLEQIYTFTYIMYILCYIIFYYIIILYYIYVHVCK